MLSDIKMALFKWELKTQNQSLVYDITMSGGQKELKIEDLESILQKWMISQRRLIWENVKVDGRNKYHFEGQDGDNGSLSSRKKVRVGETQESPMLERNLCISVSDFEGSRIWQRGHQFWKLFWWNGGDELKISKGVAERREKSKVNIVILGKKGSGLESIFTHNFS